MVTTVAAPTRSMPDAPITVGVPVGAEPKTVVVPVNYHLLTQAGEDAGYAPIPSPEAVSVAAGLLVGTLGAASAVSGVLSTPSGFTGTLGG
jgi:hypothetical protein